MKKYIYLICTIVLIALGQSVYADELSIQEIRPVPVGLTEGISLGEIDLSSVESSEIELYSMKSNTSSLGDDITLFDAMYDSIYNYEEEYYTEEDLVFSNGTIPNPNGCLKFPVASLGYKIPLEDFTNKKCYDFIKLFYECGELYISKQYYYTYYTSSTDNNKYIADFYIFYMTKKDSIDAMRKTVDDKVDAFINSLGDDLTDLEKVLLVHDFIVGNTTYGYTQYTTQNGEIKPTTVKSQNNGHSMYGVLIDGVGVCQSYTEAMCYILDKLDVECVSCVCDDINHVWNCVKIDGKWYHVDATWNDVEKINTLVDIQTEDGVVQTTITIKVSSIKYTYFLTTTETAVTQKGVNTFVYPSGKLKGTDATDETYYSGYSFLKFSIQLVGINQATTDIRWFINKGYSYENGRIVNTVETNINGIFEYYKFPYDSIKNMPMTVSKPLYNSAKECYYMIFNDGSEYATRDTTSLWIKTKANGATDVKKGIAEVEKVCGKYVMKKITDQSLIEKLTNSEDTSIYIWNEMKPMTYVIDK